jgi:hypothetical protein
MAEGSYCGFSDGYGTKSAVKWLEVVEVIQPVGCQVQR